jgi:hypothetical protein
VDADEQGMRAGATKTAGEGTLTDKGREPVAANNDGILRHC